MSYRDPEQSIKQPVHELTKAIEAFSHAVNARVIDGQWADRHIDKLIHLASELSSIRYRLLRLVEGTW